MVSNMIERLMFKLGLDKPNIYDVMNKFIRKNMSKEYIEYLEWNAVSIDSMMIDCNISDKLFISTRASKDDFWTVPSCEVFAHNMELFKGYLPLIATKIDELKESSRKRQEKWSEQQEKESSCLMKIWDKLGD